MQQRLETAYQYDCPTCSSIFALDFGVDVAQTRTPHVQLLRNFPRVALQDAAAAGRFLAREFGASCTTASVPALRAPAFAGTCTSKQYFDSSAATMFDDHVC